MTGIEFINQKREEVRKATDSWKIYLSSLSEHSEAKLKKTLSHLNTDELFLADLINARKQDTKDTDPNESFRKILDVMSNSLKDDLNVYTNNQYSEMLEKSGLLILESGDIHAGCISKNDYNETLDGYAIFINLGTYYSLQLLAKTIIIENFTNAFEKYRRQATEYIDLATNIYISQDPSMTEEIFFFDYPADVESEASAAQSSVVIKVMQFISLHELGHIVNGDLEIMGFHKRFMNNNAKENHNLSDVEVTNYHQSEFDADLFALNALLNTDISDISKWSSFYPIFYFLVWLNAIEIKFGHILSNQHPNALIRAKRLHTRMLEITNNLDLGYNESLQNVITYFDTWAKK